MYICAQEKLDDDYEETDIHIDDARINDDTGFSGARAHRWRTGAVIHLSWHGAYVSGVRA
jgi:hypothetical protein